MEVKLVTFGSGGERLERRLTEPVTVIGRDEACDLQLLRGSLSRRHCELRLSRSQITVKDLDSSNGTYVNGRRIEETRLVDGDKLTIGGGYLHGSGRRYAP